MKLSKAIEIGELNIKEAGKKMPPDTLDALKLLVEATNVFQILRSQGNFPAGYLLLSETPEN